MQTKERKIKRKIRDIEIPEKVFQSLSEKASSEDTDLKKYVENLLIKEVELMEDSEVYKQLKSDDPDGEKMLTDKEQDEFENWLGLNLLLLRVN